MSREEIEENLNRFLKNKDFENFNNELTKSKDVLTYNDKIDYMSNSIKIELIESIANCDSDSNSPVGLLFQSLFTFFEIYWKWYDTQKSDKKFIETLSNLWMGIYAFEKKFHLQDYQKIYRRYGNILFYQTPGQQHFLQFMYNLKDSVKTPQERLIILDTFIRLAKGFLLYKEEEEEEEKGEKISTLYRKILQDSTELNRILQSLENCERKDREIFQKSTGTDIRTLVKQYANYTKAEKEKYLKFVDEFSFLF